MKTDNPQQVNEAFGRQSTVFDHLYDTNPIVGYMREIIRAEVLKKIKPGESLLEMNAGTGTDAIFFAGRGIRVEAFDISQGMVAKAKEKITELGLQDRINFTQRSFYDLDKVEGEFDHVYSNFGGLNCTPDIEMIILMILDKLKSGKSATLVIMPPITLWEKAHFLLGKWDIATRRKTKRRPSKASIEGQPFKCWYYEPKELTKLLKPIAASVSVQGLCVLVPPSFLRSFPMKLPRIYKSLCWLDSKIWKLPPFYRVGDYFILSFTKK